MVQCLLGVSFAEQYRYRALYCFTRNTIPKRDYNFNLGVIFMSIFTIIILLIIFSRIKSDGRVSDLGKVIATIFAISVLLRKIKHTLSIFSAIAALLGILATMAIPLGIVLFLIYKYVIKQDTDKNTKIYGCNEETKEKMKDREKNHKNTYENPAPLKS